MISTTKKSAFYSLLTTLVAASFLFACQEDETLTPDTDASTDRLITDESIADDLFEDIDGIIMEAAIYSTSGRVENSGPVTSAGCVTRSVVRSQNDLSSTVTLTFDAECEGPKGRTRTGTLLVNRSIDLQNATYTLITTFQDFYVNGRKIEGSRTLEYTTDDKQLITVNITLSGGKITLEDGSVITREGSFTRIIDRENGQVKLTGSASGINRSGTAYVAEITSALVIVKDCAADGIFMPARGIKEISRVGKPDVQIDFGDGSCDKNVTLTAEGKKRTVVLSINKK